MKVLRYLRDLVTIFLSYRKGEKTMAKTTAKKNNTFGVTDVTIGNFTLGINQNLHGIEISGTTTTQQDKYLKEKLGFWFSKRKGHYWKPFDEKTYEEAEAYLKTLSEASKAKKKNGGKPLTMAQAAPIDMAKAFPDKKKEKDDLDTLFGDKAEEQIEMKQVKEATTKAEPKKQKAEPKKQKAEPKKQKAEPKKAEPKKAEPKKTEPKKTEPKKADDLTVWKSNVLAAVERILDESIQALAKEEAA